jgi:disulfide bond formation protein DsbB
LFLAWLMASVSTLGALFLGEVMGYTPCVLCWYQRIAMFPLVLILAAGLFPLDRRVVRYALPLALDRLGAGALPLGRGLRPDPGKCRHRAARECRVRSNRSSGSAFLTLPMLSVHGVFRHHRACCC